ncbi:hypothetical protein OH77DRAFT_1524535 [Trametes cingulata]|nr:hypothetical protein OH77DRAFT_1524535 [Trametes cingulata]
MPAHSGVGRNEDSAERSSATSSALGFLSRGIQSVSRLVGNISFSLTRTTAQSGDNDSTVTQHGTRSSDNEQIQYGSSSEEDGYGHRAHAFDSASEEEQPATTDALSARSSLTAAALRVGQSSVASTQNNGQPPRTSAWREIVPPRRVINFAGSGPSSHSASPSRPGPSSSSNHRASSSRAPLRREGAFYGLPQSSASTSSRAGAPQAPRRRRCQLRREPVYIEGQDPSEVTDASELRGVDPRAMPENRYWLPEWGPIPTLQDIFPDPEEEIDPTVVVDWIARNYGRGTDAFLQATHFLLSLSNGEQYHPRYRDIVHTADWRRQGADWEGGIEPVDRVRGPARADDAADSQAEAESIGYISSEDSMAVDDLQPGTSSMAMVLASRPSRSSSSRGPPSPSSSSSGGAGPSTSGSSRRGKRRRELESDAEHSTTSSHDEERPRTRRRLGPPSPQASSGSSSVYRQRLASRSRLLVPRNASFAVHPQVSRPRRNAGTQTSPPPPDMHAPHPGPSGSLQLPQIVVTPPSPYAQGDSGSQVVAGPSTSLAPPSSGFLAPPSPLMRPRRLSPPPTLFGTRTPTRGSTSARSTASSSSRVARSPPVSFVLPGSPRRVAGPGPLPRLRLLKRARDETGDDNGGRGSDGKDSKRKRREK